MPREGMTSGVGSKVEMGWGAGSGAGAGVGEETGGREAGCRSCVG